MSCRCFTFKCREIVSYKRCTGQRREIISCKCFTFECREIVSHKRCTCQLFGNFLSAHCLAKKKKTVSCRCFTFECRESVSYKRCTCQRREIVSCKCFTFECRFECREIVSYKRCTCQRREIVSCKCFTFECREILPHKRYTCQLFVIFLRKKKMVSGASHSGSERLFLTSDAHASCSEPPYRSLQSKEEMRACVLQVLTA